MTTETKAKGKGNAGNEKAKGKATTGAEPSQAKTVPNTPENRAAITEVQGNPFGKADVEKRRLKVFLFGDTGSGKTSLALNFPAPAVIDTEGGTHAYGDVYDFHRIDTTDPVEIPRVVEWLRKNHHDFRTLVIDPVTVYWEALVRAWNERLHRRRAEGKSGHYGEFYELQPRDWSLIKSDLKALMRTLISLDLNVVVTAREKAQYSDGGELMKKIGETFDAERSLPYLFDVVLRLKRDPTSGKFVAFIVKDRGGRVSKHAEGGQIIADSPGEIYEAIADAFGSETIEAEAEPVPLATTEQLMEMTLLADEIGMTKDQVRARCKDRYGVNEPDDLTEEDATEILVKLRDAVERARDRT